MILHIRQNDGEYSSLGVLSHDTSLLCSGSRSPGHLLETAPCPDQYSKVTREALLSGGRIGAGVGPASRLPLYLMESPLMPFLISSSQMKDGAGMVSQLQNASRTC